MSVRLCVRDYMFPAFSWVLTVTLARRKLPRRVWVGAPAANDLGAFYVQFYAISRIFYYI